MVIPALNKPRWVLLEFLEVPAQAAFRYKGQNLQRSFMLQYNSAWNDDVCWDIPSKAVVAMKFSDYERHFSF